MEIKPHSVAWYARLASQQEHFIYPWRSTLPAHHGEDDFAVMVAEQITPDTDLFEVACAHGDLALHFAPHCRSVLAYDVVPRWIDHARTRAAAQGITNATFICHDSSADANGGRPRLPADDASCNLLISSKGPFHWIEDALRVARPPATLLMLVPDNGPVPEWNDRLPVPLQRTATKDPDWARPTFEQRLAMAGLSLDSWWSYDVPELLPDVEALYAWLTWGMDPATTPPLDALAPAFTAIFGDYALPDGLPIRRRRYIWKALVA